MVCRPDLEHYRDDLFSGNWVSEIGFSLEGHPMTRFTTGGESGEDEKKHVGDEYFLESNDKIRFFFEEGFSGSYAASVSYLPRLKMVGLQMLSTVRGP